MIKYLGYGPNGAEKTITFNERQIENLINIIKGYKEELCGSRQDITACEELLKVIKQQKG